MKTLTVTFDVSALTDDQIDSLIACVSAQAEAYDGEDESQSYPDLPVLGTSICRRY